MRAPPAVPREAASARLPRMTGRTCFGMFMINAPCEMLLPGTTVQSYAARILSPVHLRRSASGARNPRIHKIPAEMAVPSLASRRAETIALLCGDSLPTRRVLFLSNLRLRRFTSDRGRLFRNVHEITSCYLVLGVAPAAGYPRRHGYSPKDSSCGSKKSLCVRASCSGCLGG